LNLSVSIYITKPGEYHWVWGEKYGGLYIE